MSFEQPKFEALNWLKVEKMWDYKNNEFKNKLKNNHV